MKGGRGGVGDAFFFVFCTSFAHGFVIETEVEDFFCWIFSAKLYEACCFACTCSRFYEKGLSALQFGRRDVELLWGEIHARPNVIVFWGVFHVYL